MPRLMRGWLILTLCAGRLANVRARNRLRAQARVQHRLPILSDGSPRP